jgi:hypothetical protein
METEDGTICVWCKRDLPRETATSDTSQAESEDATVGEERTEKFRIGKIPVIITLSLVLLCLIGLFIEPKPSEFDAIIAARKEVRDMLLAPDTARFRNDKAFLINKETNEWIVKGEVTAQNAFGVPLRHFYEVHLRLIKYNEYIVVSRRIDPY